MKYFLLFISLLSFAKANAVRLPAVLSNNMVLQQNDMVKFWGWGNPPEKIWITTSWNNKTDSVITDGNGKWELKMPTPKAGGPFNITIKGNNTIELQNILIGEVWVCAGQSNMEMNYYWGLPQMNQDFATANNNNIRFFNIPRTSATSPQDDVPANWVACDSNTVKYFSAVAYYFGKKLNQQLNVPIGLVLASWGGTPAEAWTPAEAIANDDILNTAAKQIKYSQWWPVMPGYNYNATIAPLTKFTIAGAIWYQGESNTNAAATYQRLFSTMIKAWRAKWEIDFPFYYVQLAPYHYGNKNVAALLREAQLNTLSVPKTGMAVITDLPVDTNDIHPRAKREVGYRLADIALTDTYSKQTGAKIARIEKMETTGKTIELSFGNAGVLTHTGKTVDGFEIAGEDKIFYAASAKITNNRISLTAKEVKAPVAVRYAFSNTAQGNVFTGEGLPLSPFRTDNWVVETPAY